jgi:MFS transporter (putative signal transducer)
LNTLATQSARATPYIVLGLLSGLYAAQSITGSMVQTALPVALRDTGVQLDQIGLLALLILPWALKFLWAPLIDRYGTQRNWILACQLTLIVLFIVAARLPPQTHLPRLSMVLLGMAFVAATQDVATDSLAVQATTHETRGKASGASTAGSYLGFLIGSGLWLPIYAYGGWAASMQAMAGFVAILTLPTLAAVHVGRNESATRTWPSIRGVMSNRALVGGIGFLILYQCGVRLGTSMLGPFMVDIGIPVPAIGWIRGAGGAVVGLLAALCGAALVQRFGAGRTLAAVAVLNLAACAALSSFALGLWDGAIIAIGLILVQAAAVAISFVALYAFMMNWSDTAQAATDFAVLQSLDAALAVAMGMIAGMVAEHAGHGVVFAAAAIVLALGAWRALKRSSPLHPLSSRSQAIVPSTVIPEYRR